MNHPASILSRLAALCATIAGLQAAEPVTVTPPGSGAVGGASSDASSRGAPALKADESVLIFPGYARSSTTNKHE
jgi:hypothetical protein